MVGAGCGLLPAATAASVSLLWYTVIRDVLRWAVYGTRLTAGACCDTMPCEWSLILNLLDRYERERQ